MSRTSAPTRRLSRISVPSYTPISSRRYHGEARHRHRQFGPADVKAVRSAPTTRPHPLPPEPSVARAWIGGMTQVLRYAAFTTDPVGGNPAGVVLDASGLDNAAMQAIAADVGYSETAYLTEPTEETRPIRYFSPKAEVPFCGHATVATAVALAERSGPGELVFATLSGIVPVVVKEESGVLRATLTSVEPYVEAVSDVSEVLDILGWRKEELDAELPPSIAYGGARHLVLSASTRQRL